MSAQYATPKGRRRERAGMTVKELLDRLGAMSRSQKLKILDQINQAIHVEEAPILPPVSKDSFSSPQLFQHLPGERPHHKE